MKCPCCGSTTEKPKPLVSIDTRLISVPGTEEPIRLPYQRVAELAYLLASKPRQIASYDWLTANIWGVTEPDNPTRAISVYTSKLRQCIAHTDWTIRSVVGLGYVFEPKQMR